jgi:MoxR-like ATPase
MDDVARRVIAWIEALDGELLERSAAIRLAVLAPLAGQHLLLVGPPGTAKTMLARRVTDMFDARLFSTLLTKFSTPEDVFGPLSLPELEKGVYARLIEGYLPSADVAFVDEIYKANASILNALLSILAERVYFNGATRVNVPLLAMIAASNEVPEDDEGLDALDDRILLRVRVDALAEPGSFARLLSSRGSAPTSPPPIPIADLAPFRERAAKVAIPERMLSAMLEMRAKCKELQLVVSDRRWRQSVDVMATCAALDGCATLEPAHLGVLNHVLWRRPGDQAKVHDAVASALGALRLTTTTASATEILALLAECQQTFGKLSDRTQRQFVGGWGGQGDSRENVERDAREAIRKAKETLRAARDWLAAIERELRGKAGLWAPFWTEVWTRLDVHAEVEALRLHDWVTKKLPQHLPALAAEWSA